MAEQTVSNPPYDVVIIGGGPAGLTAGMYAARADLRTLAIEGASTRKPDHRDRHHRKLSGDSRRGQRLRSGRAFQDAGRRVRPGDRLRRRDGGDEETVGRDGRLGDRRRRACATATLSVIHRHRGGLAASRRAGRGAVHRPRRLLLRDLRRPLVTATARWRWSAAATRRSRRRSI